ncbi:MAG TPA: SH3 domain-containing protein, partial [Anaerolineae bacterium]|nr:SH3 domain-containing protein [Anaerolineae bacterium]
MISLSLIFLFTGCGLAHEEAEHLVALDPADWPTSQAEAAIASPTPFPRATLRVEATSSAEEPQAETSLPTPAPTEPAAATSEVSPIPAEAGLSSNPDLLAALTTQALNQFSVVATGVVAAPDLSIRGGPGANYAPVSIIEPGDVFGILGKNPGGDWLYVIDASLSPGWLPTSALRVVGSLEGAPVLPPNPLAALVQSSLISASNENASAPAESTTTSGQPVLAENLTPVTTAQVDNDGLNMRQGPGANYERLATLARDDKVTILALNPGKDWALVETANEQRGWVSLTYLAVAGSIANAPIVPAAALSQASQTAPMSDSAQPATLNSTPVDTSETTVVPVSNETANPAATLGNLGPVASAKITHNPVEVRPGPGTDYAPIDDLKQRDETIPLLAVDRSGQWVLVDPTSAQPGWVALSDLTVEGSLENAPQVYTAWVESNAVEVRAGPGIYHDAVGVLSINTMVSVLGLDESKSWALVKAIPAGGLGWAPINFLNVAGRWSDLPLAPDMPLPGDGASASQAEVAVPFVPARPVSESKIVFQRSSGGDIMVINPDGSGLRRLTNGIDPVLSPDGQTVAFTRWEGETGSLWLINLDGTNERSLLGFIKQAKGPDWSPDGSQIVFNFQTGGRTEPRTECFPLDEDSSPPRPPRNVTDVRVKFGSNGPELCWKLPPDPHWGLR